MKCNETQGKWCKNKHGASKIIDMFEMYQTRRHKESSRRGGRVADVARVCRVGRWRDGGGSGGGGRGNGVGRGRRGAGGRVHRRNCAGGRAEARIGRWGGEAQGEVSARVFFAAASTDAARWSRSPNFSA
jgi:hypothetical protein